MNFVQLIGEGTIDDIRDAIADGADLDDVSMEDDWTYRLDPLMAAIVTDRMDIVDLLLKAGANPRERQSYSVTLEHTALDYAVLTGNRNAVELMLGQGLADFQLVDTLLHACLSPTVSLEIVSMLVSALFSSRHAQDGTLAGKYGNAMHFACVAGRADRVRVLLDAEARALRLPGGGSRSHAHISAALAATLLRQEDECAGLVVASLSKSMSRDAPIRDPLDALLALGVDPRNADHEMALALVVAAGKSGGSEAASLLERIVPDLLQGRGRKAALSVAVEYGNLPLAETLLSMGADVNRDGALEIAVRDGNPRMVELLLAAGARVHDTALVDAARSGRCELVDILVAAGARPDQRDHGGTTGLMVAAGRGDLDTARQIVASGASLEVRDDEGRTALFRAVEGRQVEMVELLLSLGADACAVDLQGRTALMLAGSWKGDFPSGGPLGAAEQKCRLENDLNSIHRLLDAGRPQKSRPSHR